MSRLPCGTVDIYPTLIDLVGVDVPNQPRPLDGISLVPLFTNKMTARGTPLGFWTYPVDGKPVYSARILRQLAKNRNLIRKWSKLILSRPSQTILPALIQKHIYLAQRPGSMETINSTARLTKTTTVRITCLTWPPIRQKHPTWGTNSHNAWKRCVTLCAIGRFRLSAASTAVTTRHQERPIDTTWHNPPWLAGRLTRLYCSFHDLPNCTTHLYPKRTVRAAHHPSTNVRRQGSRQDPKERLNFFSTVLFSGHVERQTPNPFRNIQHDEQGPP